MDAAAGPPQTLPFRPTEDQRRLMIQAAALNSSTEALLRAAGVGPGMRVLDLGSAMGDVVLVAARLVGRDGYVRGVERVRDLADAANRRLAAEGVAHAHVDVGDVEELDLDRQDFDAVVGRTVLCWAADPVAAIAAAARHARPGGAVCFQDVDLETPWAADGDLPLWERLQTWIAGTMKEAGADVRIGRRLVRLYRAADLPTPVVRVDRMAGTGEDAGLVEWGTATVSALLPAMARLGTGSVDEVSTPSLAARLREELQQEAGLILTPPVYGAVARLRE